MIFFPESKPNATIVRYENKDWFISSASYVEGRTYFQLHGMTESGERQDFGFTIPDLGYSHTFTYNGYVNEFISSIAAKLIKPKFVISKMELDAALDQVDIGWTKNSWLTGKWIEALKNFGVQIK